MLVLVIYLFCIGLLASFFARRTILKYGRVLAFALRTPSASGVLPLIGHGHKALKDNNQLYEFLCELSLEANEGDGIKVMWVGPIPLFFVTDPDAYKKIANTCLDKNYIYTYMERFLGSSILLANATLWKQNIKFVQPAFSPKEINNFLRVFNEQSRATVKDFECRVGKGPFEHRLLMSYATLRMLFQTAFGFTLEEENISCQEYKDSLLELENIAMKRLRNPWLHYDCLYRRTTHWKTYEKYAGILQKASMKVLKRAKEAYANRKDDSEERFRPFLELLLKNWATGTISDEHMRAELDSIIVAGFEAVSMAIAINLVVLGAHPEKQEKVYRESKEIFGDSDRDVTKEDLERMVYLEAAIRESLRVYPNAPFTGRRLDRDMKFKQHTLPEGASVFLSHWGANRQSCWGDDAAEYKPERWLDKSTLPDGLATDSAFGVGIRSCVAKVYAMVTMKTMVTHILRRYRVSATTEGMKFEIAISLQPGKGFAIALEPR